MTTALALLAAAVPLIAILLTVTRTRERDHLAFIAQRTELLRTFQQQIIIMEHANRELEEALSLATPLVAARIRRTMSKQQSLAEAFSDFADKVGALPLDGHPARSARIGLAKITSDPLVILERAKHFVDDCRGITEAVRAVQQARATL